MYDLNSPIQESREQSSPIVLIMKHARTSFNIDGVNIDTLWSASPLSKK